MERNPMRRLAIAVLLFLSAAEAQIYDILLKNGHVIDPANRRSGRFDVAISGNKIARVAPDLPAAHARVAIDVGAYFVTPGLIDIEAHFNAAAQGRNLQPDHNALPYGVTTAVDAGDGGAKEFDHAKTRVLAFVHADIDQAKVLKGAAFSFRTGAAAIRAGHLPEIVATGIDSKSVLLIRANMMTTLSKLLNLGMTPDQLVERTTVNPARAIKRSDLGALSEGAGADVAVIEMQTGTFGFLDADHTKLVGDRRLRCVLTIRNGAVVWDSEGLAAPDWIQAGPYSNYK
jgi:predicted amidohydrolase